MTRFPYCGMALIETGLELETYLGEGSEKCCICRRSLGRYYVPIVGEVVTTSDDAEICDWCAKRAFDAVRGPAPHLERSP